MRSGRVPIPSAPALFGGCWGIFGAPRGRGRTMRQNKLRVTWGGGCGVGLAGLGAALTAREQGASVIVLERAPFEERGGNSRFAIGAMRSVYAGVDELATFAGEIGADERARVDFGTYTGEQYLTDLMRVTQQRGDRELAQLLVDGSADTMRWLRRNGVGLSARYQC